MESGIDRRTYANEFNVIQIIHCVQSMQVFLSEPSAHILFTIFIDSTLPKTMTSYRYLQFIKIMLTKYTNACLQMTR